MKDLVYVWATILTVFFSWESDISKGTVYAFPIVQPPQRHIHYQQQQQQRCPPRTLTSLSFGARKVKCAVIPTPYFAENGDNNTNNNNNHRDKAPDITSTTTTTSSDDTSIDSSSTGTSTPSSGTAATTTKSIFQMIDELAQQLKVAALQANAKAAIYTTTGTTTTASNNRYSLVFTKYRYYAQACLYYTLFLIYRAYRGFFIILPAVFRETFRKLQNTIDDTPFEASETTTATANADNDTLSSEKPMSIRTRITISIISAFVLGTYVIGGAIRVTTSMVRSIMNGSNLIQSLQNAIQIQERNELSLLQKSNANQSKFTPMVNGSTSSPTTTPLSDTTMDSNRFAP
jgi:hypothetical protein